MNLQQSSGSQSGHPFLAGQQAVHRTNCRWKSAQTASSFDNLHSIISGLLRMAAPVGVDIGWPELFVVVFDQLAQLVGRAPEPVLAQSAPGLGWVFTIISLLFDQISKPGAQAMLAGKG
jgi:hypothetical protein